MTIEDLKAEYILTETRENALLIAIEKGADDATLRKLAGASRLSKTPTVVLPQHHYQTLSRGRGWARKGQGDKVVWGERTENGDYIVGPGTWAVGATDGFSRKKTTSWRVENIQVGDETWTVAN